MFYYRSKYPQHLASSLLVIVLYLSHVSLGVLDEVSLSKRVAYLGKNHFVRAQQKKADQEQFSRIEKRERIQKAIRNFKPSMKKEEVTALTSILCEVGTHYNYDPMFLLAMIFTESSLRGNAVSRVGAMGFMQIRPFVGKAVANVANVEWNGRKTLFDPHKNIKLGAHYLGQLYRKFNGNLRLAVEAYNNGPTRVSSRVRKYGYFSSPYSNRVFNTYEKLKKGVRI